MRSGFFAFSTLFVMLLLVGCSSPVTSAASPPAQPGNQMRTPNTTPSEEAAPTTTKAANKTPTTPSNETTTNTTGSSTSAAPNAATITTTNSSVQSSPGKGSGSDKQQQPQSKTSQTQSNEGAQTVTTPASSTGGGSGRTETSLNVPVRKRQHTVTEVSYPVLRMGSQGLAVLRLQQMLASLGYLPVEWKPTTKVKLTSQSELTAYDKPPSGHWSWRSKSVYNHLHGYWNPIAYSIITKGAVMAFEHDHHLSVDGLAGPKVWEALMKADVNQHKTSTGYTYVYVSKHLPERLTLWHNGKVLLSVPANTGIAAAPTPNGTWPVYLRFVSQTMSGRNPDGTKYKDPGVPYVNYFYKGDAVHGFIRRSYGYPQSLGCVELSYGNAQQAWKYLYYGGLVTVGP